MTLKQNYGRGSPAACLSPGLLRVPSTQPLGHRCRSSLRPRNHRAYVTRAASASPFVVFLPRSACAGKQAMLGWARGAAAAAAMKSPQRHGAPSRRGSTGVGRPRAAQDAREQGGLHLINMTFPHPFHAPTLPLPSFHAPFHAPYPLFMPLPCPYPFLSHHMTLKESGARTHDAPATRTPA